MRERTLHAPTLLHVFLPQPVFRSGLCFGRLVRASLKVTTGAWLKTGDIGGMHRSLVYSLSQTIVAALVCTTLHVSGQANLPLYTDHLVNGFQNWGWGTLNFANTAPVHSGSDSVSLSGTAWNVALSLNHSGFDTTPYSTVTFWANGGAGGGQVLHVYAHVNGADSSGINLSALPNNAWSQFTVSLSSIGADSKTNFERLNVQLTSNGTTNAFYIDDVQFIARPAPALVHANVNAAQPLRSVESRWFSANTAIWDSNFDTSQTVSMLKELGFQCLRFPGGSLSDEYHWATGTSLNNTWRWATAFTNFVHVATNVGAQAFITVNYGTGSAAEAAGWVRYSNVTNRYGFKYWEIGNECYGTWETDYNTNAPYRSNDGWSYATRAQDYFQQMRAADPTIKIGVVVAPGEDNYANGNTTHPATNLVNGQIHYGWTPVVLATLRSLGITPDFAVHHRYPEYTSGSSSAADCDALLLQSSAGWVSDVADLRREITQYFGPAGTNIELVCTENNSDAGAQGRQSTSLVNALYYADSLGQLMKTELNAFVWWDLRNGTDTGGNFDPTLYGWRSNGDLGIIGNLSTRYPAFYAAKLMQYFARPGDTILNATSDYLLLQAYAARRASGAISLLMINRDTVTNFNAQITTSGYLPNSSATIRSFGIPQDEAARTNGTSEAQDIASTNFSNASATFSYAFPPLSLTLFTLEPAPPTLAIASAPPQTDGQVVLQLQGQAGVRYFVQSSADQSVWNTVSTNTLLSPTLYITNSISQDGPLQFWRAVWTP
jgi:hypothetical protein